MLAALVLLAVVGACAGLGFLSQVRDAFNQLLLSAKALGYLSHAGYISRK